MGGGRYCFVRDVLEGFVRLVAPGRCVGCEERCVGVFCEACESVVEHAETPGAVFRYGGPVADAIQRFKYGGRSELGAVLGGLMRERARRFEGQVDFVAPVPLHWRRRRWRGYDQAALLANPIARSLGVPLRLRALRRTRHTPSQVELPRHERSQNMAGAFAAGRLRGAPRVLLVDDVRTTGATLTAATLALREGGATAVCSFVLAARVLGEST